MRKLLIVEDDLNSLNGLVELFVDEGYRVFGARNATTAMQTVSAYDIDIVLTDYCLPDFNGVELIGELKRKNPFLQCFLFTALLSNEVIQNSFRFGARRVFHKPLVLDELLAAVAEPLPSGYVVRTSNNYPVANLLEEESQ
ncbi:MAG: response regulator [Calditrichaeota bacterium]|nr:MAG: response regulator [Calditrichota bacterium]